MSSRKSFSFSTFSSLSLKNIRLNVGRVVNPFSPPTYVAKSWGTVCSSSPYDVVNVWGIVEELRMKFSQSRYGSLVFVGVFESGMKGGEPPVLDED